MERCFPTADRFVWQGVLHLTEADDESVFFAYEYRLATGEAYRNVELITVRDERIEEIQVFFGGARTDPDPHGSRPAYDLALPGEGSARGTRAAVVREPRRAPCPAG